MSSPASPAPAAPATASPAPRPYAPDPRVRWGAPAGLLAILAVAAVFVALLGVISATRLDPHWADLLAWVIGYGAVLVAVLIVTRTRGTGSLVADYGLRFRWYDILIGIGSGMALLVVTAPLTVVVEGLFGAKPVSNDVAAGDDGWWLLINGFVAVAIVAPFFEELLFRGLLLRGIRNSVLRGATGEPTRGRRAAAAILAVGLSALLFAAAHLREGIGSPVTMVTLGLTTLCLGIVNGVYAAKLGRLGPGIATHMTFNLIAATFATLNAHA